MSSSPSQSTQTSPVLVLFARGVVARLSLWSVLRLAVDQSWGGPESKQKRTWMASIIVDSFDPSQQTSHDGEPDDIYVEEQLLQMMNDEFDIVIEDGSAEPVARDIVRLWTSLASNTSESEKSKAEGIVEEWEAQAAKEKGKSVQAVVQEDVEEVDGDADDAWEDDDSSGDEEGVDVDNSEAPQLIDNSRRKEKEEPIVDEDGFTMVQGKGKGRGH